MRYAELIESVYYRGGLTTKYSHMELDKEIVVLKNPTIREFERFRDRTVSNEIRGLLDDELLVWDAYIATHSDVAAFFKVDGSDLHLEPNSVTMNDCPYDWTDEDAAEAAKWIKTHPAIVRLYGQNVPLTMESPDSGKTWQF